jgi:hypothetical protein
MAGGAGDESLGGVGEDDDVACAGAAVDGGADGSGGGSADGVDRGGQRGYVGQIDDGDAVASMVGDDKGFAVGGDAEGDGLLSSFNLGDFAAGFELKDGDGVGAGVGDVGEGAGGIDVDGDGSATVLFSALMTEREPSLLSDEASLDSEPELTT